MMLHSIAQDVWCQMWRGTAASNKVANVESRRLRGCRWAGGGVKSFLKGRDDNTGLASLAFQPLTFQAQALLTKQMLVPNLRQLVHKQLSAIIFIVLICCLWIAGAGYICSLLLEQARLNKARPARAARAVTLGCNGESWFWEKLTKLNLH